MSSNWHDINNNMPILEIRAKICSPNRRIGMGGKDATSGLMEGEILSDQVRGGFS